LGTERYPTERFPSTNNFILSRMDKSRPALHRYIYADIIGQFSQINPGNCDRKLEEERRRRRGRGGRRR